MTLNTWKSTLAALVWMISYGVTAQAGPPGDWTRFTGTKNDNIDEAAAARTPDGVLHVVWLRKNGEGLDYMHSAVSAQGALVGAPVPILRGWNTLVNPALVVSSAGELWLFFSGIRSTDNRDPYSKGSLYVATSDASGKHWTLRPGSGSQSHNVYESSTAAVLMKGGQPAVAWALSSGLGLQFGFDRKTPDTGIERPCCTYHPGLAVDAVTGETVLAWYANVEHGEGVMTQTVAPQLQGMHYAPNSATADRSSSVQVEQAMPVASRIGAPGVYVAYCGGYPQCTSINLWRHGSAAPMVIAKPQDGRDVNLAQGPEGRLWVMWASDTMLHFTRSNRAVTRFGPVESVESPKDTQTVFKLKGNGQMGPLDVLAHMQNYPAEEMATWHTQVLAPLSLTVQPNGGSQVTFLVTDVGDPVEGATITVDGKTVATDVQGRATASLSKGSGIPAATASKAGYQSASLRPGGGAASSRRGSR